MALKSINELPFLRQYDKLIAVIVLVALIISLFYLTNAGMDRKNKEDAYDTVITSLKPTGQTMKAISMDKYNGALKMAATPPSITPPDNRVANFLSPELRVTCINESCQKPIPFEALICPFCNKEQPKIEDPPDLDSDGDGLSDKIELKYGLNPKDPADVAADLDGDGFSNADEINAGYNHKDAKSHPSLMNLLKVKSIQGLKIPFILRNMNKMPDGLQMAFFIAKPQKQILYVKEGRNIGETGWIAVKAEKKYERRKNPSMPGNLRNVEVSTVVVRRKSDNKEVTMVINEGRKDTDVEASIVLPLDQSEYAAVEGGTFKVREETYRVVSVDKEALSVVVENESTGKQKVITKLD